MIVDSSALPLRAWTAPTSIEHRTGTIATMGTTLPLRAWTAAEYEQMVAAGVLGEDDRVELVEGEIVEMAPVGARHAASVNALARLLQRQVGDRALVSVQNPVRLSPRSEPQPDLAVLAWRDDGYRDELPGPADVLLVVEVAESSVATDRDVKLPLYGRAGIGEAWLVDLPAGTIEVHTGPSPAGYRERSVHGIRALVSPVGLVAVVVAVGEAVVA
jgi:Uma2 family endonuclease